MRWPDLPPDTATVLRNAHKKKLVQALNIFFYVDGSCSVTAQGKNGELIKATSNTDSALAVALCLGPPPGESWKAWLAEDKPVAEPEEDDDFSDVI